EDLLHLLRRIERRRRALRPRPRLGERAVAQAGLFDGCGGFALGLSHRASILSTMAETKPADEPIFRALLTPHRSLGRTGFLVLMGAVAFMWLGTGAFFLSLGAWPVF